MGQKKAIRPTRSEDYPEWYQSVVKAADLAEHSAVRGCMVIKPWGYGIWENIQRTLDDMFKKTGHENAYFPLFIPLSYLQKEAEHVEGFAKECAVVTHHKLEKNKEGKLVPASPLEEPLIVRPTSEMIIGDTFSRWVQSYRDLPLLINQWANVVRWEMRTRLFLRTAEFLWQEGHTVHSTKEEAEEEAFRMLDIYVDFTKNYLAMPVIPGRKTASQRFPGAVETYTMESMMQDRKALQAGTSHFLGQNFSKSCNIQFQNVEGDLEYGWMTSWGVSTRLIGGMIMTHSDDDGLILPPKIASKQIVILPLIQNQETKTEVLNYAEKLFCELEKKDFSGSKIKVILDKREMRGGEKNWSWIKKGIPIRIEIGFKEKNEKKVCFIRRDQGPKDRLFLGFNDFIQKVPEILQEIQENLLLKATEFRDQHTKKIDNKEDFYSFFTSKNNEIHGGFALCHFHEDLKMEEKIQKDLNVSIRCVPLDGEEEDGKCFMSSKPSKKRMIFAKSY